MFFEIHQLIHEPKRDQKISKKSMLLSWGISREAPLDHTKTKSIRGSDGSCSIFSPSGPLISSPDSLARLRVRRLRRRSIKESDTERLLELRCKLVSGECYNRGKNVSQVDFDARVSAITSDMIDKIANCTDTSGKHGWQA